MATTLDIEIFKVINAGNFWAHPVAGPSSEFQDFMGKLNDHFRKDTNSQANNQVEKGQMCVVRRTSDNCWYRARVQTVLQTLSGPQASVFLVDMAESTLVPCCRIREIPELFQNIPFQAMECLLVGVQPLGLVTSYFDLTTSKQVTDHWDEAATNLFKTLIQGCKLQVTIHKQDEKGKYHVLLLADSGYAQVCVNDELVLNGFATNFSEDLEKPRIKTTKAAKLKAMGEKFQKEGEEMLKNMKEYVRHGKFSGSEESNSTDEESMSQRSTNRYLGIRESPLVVLRQQVLGHGSCQENNSSLQKPSARLPEGACEGLSSQRLSEEKTFSSEKSEDELMHASRKPAAASSDNNSGRVRFLSSRLPATGSGMRGGFHPMSSKSPDAVNLKPILKKKSAHSGSSTEADEFRPRRRADRDGSGVSYCEIPEFSSNGSNGEIFLKEIEEKEQSPRNSSISVDTLFSQHNVRLPFENSISAKRIVQETESLSKTTAVANRNEEDRQKLLSSIKTLKETCERDCGSTLDPSTDLVQTCEPPTTKSSSEIACRSEHSPIQSSTSLHMVEGRNLSEKSTQLSQLLQTSCGSFGKSPLPSEILLSTQKSASPVQRTTSGKKLLYSDGVIVCSEGAPAPKPVFSPEFCPFPHYLLRLGILNPSLLQAHAWPALLRGRDLVGICQANDAQIHAYLLPIIYQLVEEREIYADLPKFSSGPQFLILASTWGAVVDIFRQCRLILAKNRNIRVQLIFAAGAEENQIIPLVNGCEILIATPPCFLRMLRKCYISLDRLCHLVFHDADIMVEDFTSEIKCIMRHYAKLLRSQPCRSAPRQAVVMASSWSVGIASLVKAYLGNPVVLIPDMVEAAIYRGVQQIVTFCSESQRDVELLGYLESFISTKDICVFTSTAAEAENVGQILNANCYFALVAHNFLPPHELHNIQRQWNTPHTTDTMPVLVIAEDVIGQMNITNASCVIHFNFPGSKTRFSKRLSTLAGTFTSSDEHGCVSVIFVTDGRNMYHAPSIRQLVQRSGQEVPQLLDAMADLAKQEKEKVKELCYSLKAFGTCRYQRGTRNCLQRHSVLAELDKPAKGIPTSGIVKILITSVMDATCYWVRILEHKPSGANPLNSRTVDCTEFLELTMAVSRWYADSNHRVKQELVSVGDLCAVKLINSSSYNRVKVCYVTKEDHSKKPVEVRVQYVDRGNFELVHVDRLLQLPPQFHSCPFQAVEVFVCRLQPLDKDTDWTDETAAYITRLIEGKEMEGRVVLSLGNTMWLDPLVERKYLPNINVTTNALNVRMELLREKRAAENKQHVRLLRNLCEGVIVLQPLEGGQTRVSDVSEQLPALETSVLPEEGFHSVYVSAVENPGLFFVQLKSSGESLEDLKQKINSGVNKVESEENEIPIGSLCVAKFSEDDLWYRARVLGSRPDKEYDVFYVDFGDREWVTADRIVPAWNDILQLPLQAVECSLVHVEPLEKEWSDESSDAFWEMVTDQLLFAKVKSKSASLVAGCHRFAIELYDTNTEHDVIISHEMVATGHAQTSAEGIKDLVKKAEIVKEVQSIVLNNEKSKDDIRDCGGVQALCRLLSLSRDPLVLQHILASLASLSFDNTSNCDEVTSQGGLQAMCYLLGKTKDSIIQESIAWALKNLGTTERNQNEARTRGGLRAFCELLRTTMDDKVLERVTWAIGSLVDDNTRNCQAVRDCGGLKTICELVSLTYSENVLERTMWALGNLAIDNKNRNFIRQYGGLENICKKLQESTSQQIIKQGALTLKTLASSNQHNKDVMVRLGVIGTLRSLMTNEQQSLGIIPRRVCGDLLQRLLGSAAGNIHTTSSTATAPDDRAQECAIASGIIVKQEPETRSVNGLVQNGDTDNEEDDDLPPLGGEDSDEKNERIPSAVITLAPNTSENLSPRENFSRSETQGIAAARSTVSVRNHDVPRAEENDLDPFSVHPKTVWSQTRELVRVCVKLRGVERQQTEITASKLKFSTQLRHVVYELDMELLEEIDPEQSTVIVKGSEVQILLKKRNHAVWTRLLKSKEKLPYVSIDFDRWEVWSSSEEDETEDDVNFRAAPTNPENSHHTSEDSREGRKLVLLPEMLVSGSESDTDETLPSDVDCLKFY